MTRLTPDITSVTVVDRGVLRLSFADGLSAEFDVLDRMREPIFVRRAHPPDSRGSGLIPKRGPWYGRGAPILPPTRSTCER